MAKVKELSLDTVKGRLRERQDNSHKGTFGRLLCLVGSDRYRGAAVLSVKGALMCGAGLIGAASTEKALAAVAAHHPEAILLDTHRDTEAALSFARSATAAVIGCGLTDTLDAQRNMSAVIMKSRCPLVIDADGINLLAADIELLNELDGKTVIITPHIGEFSRLTGKTAEEILSDRVSAASEYAEKSGFTVVLKSDRTVIALSGGTVYENTLGNSGLAKGGSGDLLSGAIGSVLAMGYSAEDAALIGVYVHSRAADLLAELIGKHSMTPSAVAEFMPSALGELTI